MKAATWEMHVLRGYNASDNAGRIQENAQNSDELSAIETGIIARNAGLTITKVAEWAHEKWLDKFIG